MDIELVIKIPDVIYEGVKMDRVLDTSIVFVLDAIKNGTPLPKGHGDIVDIKTLIDMFWDGDSMEITKYDLSVIEPIVEADKEEKDGNDD